MNLMLKKLLGALPEPPTSSLDHIHGCFTLVLDLLRRVPPSQLTPDQRMRQVAPYLFEEGPDLVDQLCFGLARRAEQFPELPPDEARTLSARLDRAESWSTLEHALRLLADWAGDHAALERAAAVRRALDILAHVRQDAARRLGPRPDSRRAAAVAPAETIRRMWQASKRPA